MSTATRPFHSVLMFVASYVCFLFFAIPSSSAVSDNVTATQGSKPPVMHEKKDYDPGLATRLEPLKDCRRCSTTFNGLHFIREEHYGDGVLAFHGDYLFDQEGQRLERFYEHYSTIPVTPSDEHILSGKESRYYENGQQQSRFSYSKGKKHGDWSYWLPNGVYISHEQWKDGVEDGEWLIFDPVSKMMRRVVYKQGEIIEPQSEVIGSTGGIDEYLQDQAKAKREQTNRALLILLVCIVGGFFVLCFLGILIGALMNATDSKSSSYLQPSLSKIHTTPKPMKNAGGSSSLALGSSSVYIPPLPPGRTIPTVPWVRYTPSGEVQTSSGSALGRIDSATGNVIMPAGHVVGNVKDVKNPDEAAAIAYRKIDDDAC